MPRDLAGWQPEKDRCATDHKMRQISLCNEEENEIAEGAIFIGFLLTPL